MRGLPLLLAAAVSTGHPSPAQRDVALAQKGLDAAVSTGAISVTDAADYGAALRRAIPLARTLPPLRAQELRSVLHDVASMHRAYRTPQRSLILFSTLAANEEWLTDHRLPASGTDVVGEGGVVYRYFPGHGLVFHPLAEFAQLNTLLGAGDVDGARTLVDALLARGIPSGGALRWEYEFPFSVGRPPWTSGMAQAVAAQALARASQTLADPALLDAARAAWRAVPRLTLQLPAGPWVKLYAWSSIPVLNAQLQTVLSVGDYASIAGDADASAFAGRLQQSAAALLPRFDTGYWSLYSLRGDEAPLGYQDYVISLLRRLAARTGDQTWRDVADRFEGYESEPPILRADSTPETIYPDPQDGFRDAAPLRFWLSKASTVTLRAGKTVERLTIEHGEHTIWWSPGPVASGLYRPRIAAVDPAGNRATATFAPVTLRSDVTPPKLDVTVIAPSAVHWEAEDAGTPWLRLALRLARPGAERFLPLGQRGLNGTAHPKLPPGRWHVTLVAANSAGRVRTVSLGFLPR
jgi:D-glucuronyl C5-epimerase-like protein